MKPSSLQKSQTDFQAYILSGELTITDSMVTPKNMTVLDRLNVYQNGYYERIIQSMSQDFPIIFHLIDESAFASMVCDYLAVYPSRYASLRYVGKQLSDFLKQQDASLAGFADLAHLEFSLCEIALFPLPDTLTLDLLMQLMQKSNWETYVLQLHPAMLQLQTQFNVLDILQAYHNDEPLGEITLLEKPLNYLVWPSEEGERIFVLDARAKNFIDLLEKKVPFNKVCEYLSDHSSADQETLVWVSETLQKWIQMGLFTIIKKEAGAPATA